jgi:excinuclease ABC subunit C
MVSQLTSLQNGAKIIQKYTETLPKKPGVYRMLDANQKILYIGKAKKLIE